MPQEDLTCIICQGELRKVPPGDCQLMLRCPDAKHSWRVMPVTIVWCRSCGHVDFFAKTNLLRSLTKVSSEPKTETP